MNTDAHDEAWQQMHENHVLLSCYSLFINTHVAKSCLAGSSTHVRLRACRKRCKTIMCDLQANNPFKAAMRSLPLLYGASVGVVLSLVLIKAEPTHAWPAWRTAVVTLAVAVAVVVVVQLLLVPQLRQKIHCLGPGRVGSAASNLTGREAAASSEPKISVL